SEITFSLHGVTNETYENMMQKGDFDKFLNVLKLISKVKEKHELKLRINYTFNEDNFEELSSFYEVFDEVDIDILQIRPIVKIGNTEYNNFSLEKVIPVYDEVQKGLLAESQKRGVTLLSHKPKKLKNRVSLDSVIKKYVYCYISPTSLFRKDFKWGDETYNQYARRRGIPGRILKDALKSKKTILNYADDKLNYDIN
ncbi:MAG: radical SAM protein, partial [Flavobacteriaceae bacterium]|nr:radical SAM protein [Flavobacteriaceae bacterium]